ncbi:metalloregulator ArsR/SmtB family transcription factor [Actinotalea sp.]|uniref:ArsR/SmtB family transcription factor n=1 Tax=Actinotalea sp. TaxID=1872145 RepID=UPI002C335577|nr:metalloregulator ArsR/SmtB family transcription factor [Actinotalea sp.]HQY32619.1 metalloregulator ArsR/SmtB family transcription factor [Actinotalea sp.]HRA51084.1 metalloregulator ArsR/SmtB family transcription factor [Actinotalea sp.]
MGRDAKRALFEQFARIGKALSSPTRVELIDLLAQGERPVDSLARATGAHVTTVSAHLQALRQARLVSTRREGTRIFYRLAGADVAGLYLQVQRLAEHHLPDLPAARAAFLGPEDVEEIDRDELWRRAEQGTVTVIDVRPSEEYAGGHLPGAISIPLDELAGRLAELPTGSDVVAYCRGPYCVLSYAAVRLLRDHGRPARRLADGVLEWRAAELPVEGADVA